MISVFSKIWIVVIALAILTGGIFAWQYLGFPAKEGEVKEINTEGWTLYADKQFQVFVRIPPDFENRSAPGKIALFEKHVGENKAVSLKFSFAPVGGEEQVKETVRFVDSLIELSAGEQFPYSLGEGIISTKIKNVKVKIDEKCDGAMFFTSTAEKEALSAYFLHCPFQRSISFTSLINIELIFPKGTLAEYQPIFEAIVSEFRLTPLEWELYTNKARALEATLNEPLYSVSYPKNSGISQTVGEYVETAPWVPFDAMLRDESVSIRIYALRIEDLGVQPFYRLENFPGIGHPGPTEEIVLDGRSVYKGENA
ncbi:MAG: hypothetical protein Q8P55_01825, partial [bacterium]|nr:hypothetical protein [bacterium]